MLRYAEKIFKTPDEEPFYFDEQVDSKIYQKDNLNIVEQAIQTSMRQIENRGHELRNRFGVINVEESLETIMFGIFREPSLPFGNIKRLPRQINFKTQLQRNL